MDGERFFFSQGWAGPQGCFMGQCGESPLPAGQGVHPCCHHQHPHHHRKSTLSAHLQVVIARCHAFIENGISMETNLWSLVTQELMVSGFFRKYFFRSFTPPFLSQDFFSFPSLYETSLNDHEPSIANDLRETHTKWFLKKLNSCLVDISLLPNLLVQRHPGAVTALLQHSRSQDRKKLPRLLHWIIWNDDRKSIRYCALQNSGAAVDKKLIASSSCPRYHLSSSSNLHFLPQVLAEQHVLGLQGPLVLPSMDRLLSLRLSARIF